MEEWRQAFGHDNYEVSSHGNIRRKGKTDFLKPSYSGTGGYARVGLGAKKTSTIHKVVAETFLGTRPLKHDVNHVDGNKLNNHAANLEYVTRSENCRQACNEQGLRSFKRENHNRSKLTPSVVVEIKNMIANGTKNKDIALLFNVDTSLISHIKRGAKWY